MADEQPLIWVQLTTEHWVIGPSGKLLISSGDDLWCAIPSS
ncbi:MULTISPECIES: hypothetical protein [Lactiplantibacillus]|nr:MULTISPECIES: hypothetical protein [Lactiplantibacillus]MDY1543856.1 hypothetical protein [Lactiplantibacillus pentosus]